jgi:hypothetical protein
MACTYRTQALSYSVDSRSQSVCSYYGDRTENKLPLAEGALEIAISKSIADCYVSREMQLFLIGYILIEICEIFTVGLFPLENKVRIVSIRISQW